MNLAPLHSTSVRDRTSLDEKSCLCPVPSFVRVEISVTPHYADILGRQDRSRFRPLL